MIAWKRTLGCLLTLLVTSAAFAAGEEPQAPAAESGELAPATATEQPTAGEPASPAAASTAEAAPEPALPAVADPAAAAPPLGAVAYDSEGRQGRIHVVVTGDTLWAISDAYLGTPWVWPSIWKDNGEIENPHLIHPGDRIWITPTEMRRLTEAEAADMLANAPAALSEEAPALETQVPETLATAPEEVATVRVSTRESAGLISPEVYQSAASVVGRVPVRMLMSQEDQVYIGLGEGEVEVGDEFTLFRTNEKVFDPDSGALLGYHVELLGWLRVEETSPETSLATIRMSTSEIEEGDKVMPRQPLPPEIAVQSAPDGVDGKISFFPGRRVLMGKEDFVYLNRGTLDGLEVGSPLEVYRQGYPADEPSRDERVAVPDRVIAKMLVVRAETESSVALVTHAETELELGDHFRGAKQ